MFVFPVEPFLEPNTASVMTVDYDDESRTTSGSYDLGSCALTEGSSSVSSAIYIFIYIYIYIYIYICNIELNYKIDSILTLIQ